jgi:hypothetical protein
VEAWAEQYPDANIAVCADEDICILDMDDVKNLRSMAGGKQSRHALQIPSTYTVQSSPGKAHY